MKINGIRPALAAGILSAAALAFGNSSLAFGSAHHDPTSCDAVGMVINSNAPVVNGTPGADIINGGPASQTINGFGGADIINAGGGDDVVSGQACDDRLER